MIHYSSEAIAKLGLHLDTIANTLNIRLAELYLKGNGGDENLDFQDGIALEEDDGTIRISDRYIRVSDRYIRIQGEDGSGQGGVLADGGDTAGTTSSGQPIVSVCHEGAKQSIPKSDLIVHIGHGDYLGSCL